MKDFHSEKVKDNVQGAYWEMVSSIDPNRFADTIRKKKAEAIVVDESEYYRALVAERCTATDEATEIPRALKSASVARELVNLFQSKKFRVGRVISPEEEERWCQRVQDVLSSDEALHLVLPAICFKVNNPFKTGGALPDTAELHALLQIQNLLNEVKKITSHPVFFHYVWDGGINAPFAGVPRNDAEDCFAKLNSYADLLGDSRVTVHDYSDLILAAGLDVNEAISLEDVPLDSKEFREANIVGTSYWSSFLQTHRPPEGIQTLEEQIIWYQQMALLKETDSAELRPLMEKFIRYSRLTQYLRERRVADRAFSGKAIRFSASPRAGALGLGLNKEGRVLLPHHGVAVFNGQSWSVQHIAGILIPNQTSHFRAVRDEASNRILAFTSTTIQ